MPLSPESFFSLEGYAHRALFDGLTHVWEALGRLDEYVESRAVADVYGEVQDGAWLRGAVWVGPGVVIESGAYVQGPAILGAGTVVRHGAYVRGHCVIGERCVIGHATELKRVIMLDGAQAPHFNYVGDSILGRGTNLGAGVKISNFKNDGSLIDVVFEGRRLPTGMRKLGAVVGDGVRIGCNCVTSPGTLIGPESLIYANTVLRGVYPRRSIVKLRQETETVPREERHNS